METIFNNYIVSFILAQSQEAAPANPFMSFLPLLVLFAAFYFLIIAPTRKRQKQHEKMTSALVNGDRVVTAGGIYGTVLSVKEDRVVLKIAENTKVEIARASIQTKLQGESTPAE